MCCQVTKRSGDRLAVLSRKQLNFIEQVFCHQQELEHAVCEMRIWLLTDAAQSADPTARIAIAGMTVADPELWLDVVYETWDKYRDTEVGWAMHRRYELHEIWTRTCCACSIADVTYFSWRKEFLLSAALFAAGKGLKF